jgi:hypothetical protein
VIEAARGVLGDTSRGLCPVETYADFNRASYNIVAAGGAATALSEISGHPDDKWGGAVMAAL